MSETESQAFQDLNDYLMTVDTIEGPDALIAVRALLSAVHEQVVFAEVTSTAIKVIGDKLGSLTARLDALEAAMPGKIEPQATAGRTEESGQDG